MLKGFDQNLIWVAKDHFSRFPHPPPLSYSLPAHYLAESPLLDRPNSSFAIDVSGCLLGLLGKKKKALMILCHPSDEWRHYLFPHHLGSSQTEKSHQNLFPYSSPAHSWFGKRWCPSLNRNNLTASGPPSFQHKGLVSWKTISSRTRMGDGFGMTQAHYISCAFYFCDSYISSTSDHLALDLGGWGHLL